MSKSRLVHLDALTLGVTMAPGPKFSVLVGEANKVADVDGKYSMNMEKSKDITDDFRQIYEYITAEQAANIAVNMKKDDGPKPIKPLGEENEA